MALNIIDNATCTFCGCVCDDLRITTDGERILEFGPHAYRPYSAAEQATLRAALGQWPEGPEVAAAAEVVETAHADLMSRFQGAAIEIGVAALADGPDVAAGGGVALPVLAATFTTIVVYPGWSALVDASGAATAIVRAGQSNALGVLVALEAALDMLSDLPEPG